MFIFIPIIKSIFPQPCLNMASPRTDALTKLGFPPGSTPTEAEIKKAYHKAALKVHPDKPGGSFEAFDALTKAYELLNEPGSSKDFADNAEDFADNADSLDNLIKVLLQQLREKNVTIPQTVPLCRHGSRCKFGDKCKFHHPETPDTRPICKFFLQGACKFGDKCKNHHPVVPPICKFFLQGACKFGAKCKNSHNIA